jgi:hypothetical protein
MDESFVNWLERTKKKLESMMSTQKPCDYPHCFGDECSWKCERAERDAAFLKWCRERRDTYVPPALDHPPSSPPPAPRKAGGHNLR